MKQNLKEYLEAAKYKHIPKGYKTFKGVTLTDAQVKEYNNLQDQMKKEKDPKKMEELKNKSFAIINAKKG